MTATSHRPLMATIVRLVPLAAILVAAVVIYSLATGGSGGYIVYAKFSDASGLLTGYNVKVGGVPAGQVTDVTLDRADHAVVEMVLDSNAAPIGAGASARIRPVNLLGEKYVDLNPGSRSQTLPSGSTIALAHTATPVELDDILNTLAPDVLTRLQILVNEAGVAMAGRGADFAQTLRQLPPTLQQATALVGQIAGQNQALGALIDSGSRVVAAVNARSDNLGNLVTSAGNALRTVAGRQADLARTLQAAPGGLSQLTTTLVNLQRTASDLSPVAASLRGAAPPLATVLTEAPSFAGDATLALRAARQVSPELVRLGDQGTPLVQRLSPTARRLASFAGTLHPMLTGLDQQGGLKAVLRFIAGWAGVIEGRDGLGNVFRVHITLSPQFVTSVLQRMSAGATSGSKRHRHPVSAPALPSLGNTLGSVSAPVKGLTGTVGSTLGQVKKTLGDVQAVGNHVTSVIAGTLGTGHGSGGSGSGSGSPGAGQSGATQQLLHYLLGR